MRENQFGYDVSPEACRQRIDASLKRLGVDYLDVWVLRAVQGGSAHIEEAMAGMKVCPPHRDLHCNKT